uniref:Uncharacterized protein n=1 Tax=Anguilla anguilla TaxID=7936 RepID=A0A0E9R1A1_ANGAN
MPQNSASPHVFQFSGVFTKTGYVNEHSRSEFI